MSLEVRCGKCGLLLKHEITQTTNNEVMEVWPCECCVATQGDHGEVVGGFGHSAGSSVDMDAESVCEEAATNKGAEFHDRLFKTRKRIELGMP